MYGATTCNRLRLSVVSRIADLLLVYCQRSFPIQLANELRHVIPVERIATFLRQFPAGLMAGNKRIADDEVAHGGALFALPVRRLSSWGDVGFEKRGLFDYNVSARS